MTRRTEHAPFPLTAGELSDLTYAQSFLENVGNELRWAADKFGWSHADTLADRAFQYAETLSKVTRSAQDRRRDD